MKHRQFFIEKNETDAGPVYAVQWVEGLPALHTDKEPLGDGFLLTLEGLDEALEAAPLKENTVYVIFKMIEGQRVDVAHISCNKLILKAESHQVYLATVGQSDFLKLQILEAWSDGAVLSWRDLDPIYRNAWQSACMSLVSAQNWSQSPAASTIVLTREGMRAKEDFYCYLGDQLFGFKGYAGSNLDALYEVLVWNDLEGVTIHVPDGDGLARFLQGLRGHSDYFAKFREVLTNAKVDLRLGEIPSS